MIVEQWQQMYGSSQLWYCVPAPWGALSGLCSIFKGGVVGGVAGTLICGPILGRKRGGGDGGGGGVARQVHVYILWLLSWCMLHTTRYS